MAQAWESEDIRKQGEEWNKTNKLLDYAKKNNLTDSIGKLQATKAEIEAETDRLRGLQGYQTDGSGLNQKAMQGYQADSTNTKFTPIQQQQPQYDLTAQLQALKNAQIANSIAGLDQAKNKSMAAINTEKATIAPQYQGLRNTAATQSDIKIKNLAEYMANRGSLGAGGNDQIRTSMETSGLNNQSNLYRQEQSALDDIARRISTVERDYANGLQQAQSGADVQFIQNTLAELGALRDYGREDSRNAVLDNRYNQEFNYNVNTDTRNFDYQKQQDALDRDFQQKSFDAEQKYRNGQITFQQKQQEIDNAFREKEFARSKLESDRNYNLSASKASSASQAKPTYTPTQVSSQASSLMETKDGNGNYIYTIGEIEKWLANQDIDDKQYDDIIAALEMKYPNRTYKTDSSGRINYGVPIGP